MRRRPTFGPTQSKTAKLGRLIWYVVAVLVIVTTFVVTFAKPAHASGSASHTPAGHLVMTGLAVPNGWLGGPAVSAIGGP